MTMMKSMMYMKKIRKKRSKIGRVSILGLLRAFAPHAWPV